MAQIGNWNGFVFEVSPSVVRGFTGLTLTSGSKTEDKTSDSSQYVKRTASLTREMTMSVQLNAYFGCSVRDEAERMLSAASNGESDYFYLNNKKLFPCKMMLTNAEVSEINLSPSGEWVECNVQLTMKQCEKNGSGTSSSSSSKSSSSSGSKTAKKDSVRTTSVLTGANNPNYENNRSQNSTNKSTASSYIVNIVQNIAKAAANKTTTTTKKTTTTTVNNTKLKPNAKK